ncbi:MAG: non-homologous end-joining DNA ligase [Planctomycetes bacterium]|nr:non-homologous end-joining DNA ligase [Planctomycetota bacterium]
MATKKKKPRGSLERYDAKRDFARTPEPRGKRPMHARTHRYVLHRHDASHLHWDLRLEAEGVLRSFAIPKGVAWDPKVKRLAVRTEDHPIEYLTFEGEIPRGEYGAGTMRVEDSGTYESVEGYDPVQGLESGEIKLRLFGRKLRGEWHLVRMRPRPGENNESWLLFKAKDAYAKTSPFARGCDFSDAVPAALPRALHFAEPGTREVARSDLASLDDHYGFEPDFEVAFGGQRCWLEVDEGRVRFRGPRAREHTRRLEDDLASIASEARGIAAACVILDGVLVAESEGQPVPGDGDAFAFYATDVVYYEDWDVRPLALRERKRVLGALLTGSRSLHAVLPVERDGDGLASVLTSQEHTTMLAKELDAPYRSGKHDAWLRVRLDRKAQSNVRERKAGAKSTTKGGATKGRARASSPARESKTKRGSKSIESEHHTVRITNRDKVWFPHDGYTKGDVLDYYARVAPLLVPFLRDRPMTLRRFPDGIESEGFFQKNLPEHAPDWLDRLPIESRGSGRTIDYLVIDSAEALTFAVQEGGFELHPWLSRRGSLDEPDFALIDLDPKTAPFRDVVEIARFAHELLERASLKALLKTSGQSGLHILVPLARGYDYDVARGFAEGIARMIVQRLPKIATIERDQRRRSGRVYIDYLQNRRGQTVVAPFSVRPRPGAPVSTPLDWDELDDDLDPRDFTIRSVPAQIEKRAALMRVLEKGSKALDAALDRLVRWLES